MFVVDCQTLADISNGSTPLRNDHYRPICTRIGHNLAAVGMTLKNPVEAMECRPRTFNKLADALANEVVGEEKKCSGEVAGEHRGKGKESSCFRVEVVGRERSLSSVDVD